ncbi:MAG TPA: GyrI-like domain-containing protein [Dongiaceae bacterium]|jgi:AraC family transcriptional regulator
MQREPVRIIAVPDIRVAALEHHGDPALVDQSARQFAAWRRTVGLPPETSATYNIWHNSPIDTPPALFRMDLCAATDRVVVPNTAGVVAKTIPGGRCAVLRHVGTEDGLGEAVSYLYADWLPRSGAELRGFPLYFRRISFVPDVAEHEAITDIFLPLK